MTAETLPCGIEGITDVMHLVRAGRIRTGEKVAKNGKEYPSKWDCFNFADASKIAKYYAELKGLPLQDAAGNWISPQELSRQLKISELDFLFPVDDKHEVLDQAYMRYGSSGSWSCRGDGAIAWDRDEEDEITCAGEDCEHYREQRCKRQSRLSIVLYNISGGLTIYDIVSGGRQTAKNLSSGVDLLKIRFGQINNIPLKLYLRPYKTFYYGKDGNTHKTVPYALMIDFEASLLDIERMKQQAGQRVIMPAPVEQLADDMYPKSLQAQAPALPPVPDEPVETEIPAGPVIEAPTDEPCAPLAAVPDSPEMDEVNKGFDACGIVDPTERQKLLAEYDGRLPELDRYLMNLFEGWLPPTTPRPVPTPKPARRAAPAKSAPTTPVPKPAPAKPAAAKRTTGKALF